MLKKTDIFVKIMRAILIRFLLGSGRELRRNKLSGLDLGQTFTPKLKILVLVNLNKSTILC